MGSEADGVGRVQLTGSGMAWSLPAFTIDSAG